MGVSQGTVLGFGDGFGAILRGTVAKRCQTCQELTFEIPPRRALRGQGGYQADGDLAGIHTAEHEPQALSQPRQPPPLADFNVIQAFEQRASVDVRPERSVARAACKHGDAVVEKDCCQEA